MIYCIAFVEQQKLRDYRLDKILQDTDGILYDGPTPYMARIKPGDRIEALNTGMSYHDKYGNVHQQYSYGRLNDRAITSCSKWKTVRGAQTAVNRLNKILLTKKIRVSYDPNSFNQAVQVPVVVDITEQWNKNIQTKINDEIKSHERKIQSLKKKLV